jgi:dGTPase
MYRHPRVLDVMNRAQKIVIGLFNHYSDDFRNMPEEWRQGLDVADQWHVTRHVCDFIAGMTDRFALNEYKRLTGKEPDLRI